MKKIRNKMKKNIVYNTMELTNDTEVMMKRW